MRRSRETNNAPTDPRLRLAHRVKTQSATPSVPSTPLASTSSAATPLHGPAARSASPLLDPLGIKRSTSVQSWADQRTLMKQESPIPGIDLNQIFFTRDARIPCGHCREVLPRSNFSSRQLSQAQSKQRTAHIRRKEVTISDLPLCDTCCGVQQRKWVYCSECKQDKAPSDFSHAMKKKSSGALCRSLEKDVWAAADGGIGSSDSEDDALHEEKTTAPPIVNHTVLQSAYEKLDKPGGGQGQIIYDSSDDD
ncbi:hypothetical protein RHOSPDRAFT_32962 [Rhodotorula sp. JG-1b]|nr:hypothetical protein RHOSPDRAFT_32962 [Rhodotorula sp. JG-1b]